MVVWQHHKDNNHYQLRKAGNSLRLYRNKVFHSQYNGGRFLNGGVWDMLWLPIFFRPVDRPLRILMLGLGAGAAIKKIQQFACIGKVIAVDTDAIHIHIAKKFMGLTDATISLQKADAEQWLVSYDGPAFDVIIDDLFYEQDGEPLRAVDFHNNNGAWLSLLKRHLLKGGLLIANCTTPAEARSLVKKTPPSRRAFKYGMRFSKSAYANILAVVSDMPLMRQQWRIHLRASAGHARVKQAESAHTIRSL